MTKLKN